MVLKSTNRIVFYLLLLVAITAIVLSPSVNNDFVNFDDHVYVLKNEIITNTTSDGIKTIFDRHKPVAGNYHPLTILSYALEYKFFKLTAERYHLNSLLLHLINVLLIFWLIYLLAGNLNVAFITALLFGIHPMHVESVAWISSRKDLLYTLFFLLSMIFYLKYFFRNNLTEPIKQNRYLYLILSIIAFVLALLSKAQAVMLPIILILIDIFLRRKISIRSLLEKVPFLIASSLVLVSAQRLCRKICPQCKEPMNVPKKMRDQLKFKLPADVSFYHGKGCQACNQTGYLGRMGITELLEIDDIIRDMLIEG
ncbi:MAG: hypothetical protein IIA45_09690, partial [Bacteroidetes bacterium]|nr:hypothetical protein [Bacteroidota bacterium]